MDHRMPWPLVLLLSWALAASPCYAWTPEEHQKCIPSPCSNHSSAICSTKMREISVFELATIKGAYTHLVFQPTIHRCPTIDFTQSRNWSDSQLRSGNPLNSIHCIHRQLNIFLYFFRQSQRRQLLLEKDMLYLSSNVNHRPHNLASSSSTRLLTAAGRLAMILSMSWIASDVIPGSVKMTACSSYSSSTSNWSRSSMVSGES